jgi:NodT family efflux transporter outer membrane factor (OMF) lipoprotein
MLRVPGEIESGDSKAGTEEVPKGGQLGLALAAPVRLLRLPPRSPARTLALVSSAAHRAVAYPLALALEVKRLITRTLTSPRATHGEVAVSSSTPTSRGVHRIPALPAPRASPFGGRARTCPPTLAIGLGIAAALSGCVVGPQYKGPPATNLTDFHNTPAVQNRQTDTPAPHVETWWTGFRDPVLTRIVERALAQNLDLAAAIARVDQSRAVAREAGAQLLPSGSAVGSVTQLRQSLNSPIGAIGRNQPGYDRNQTLYDADVGAQWEIDLFGGLRRGAEAARDEAEAAEAQQLGVRVSVVADAADAYFQARGNQARLAIAQSQIETDTRLLELVRLRFSRGASAEKEVAQAEALLAQARATVPPLRTALEAQLNRLDVLMGAQPGTYAAELSQPAEIPSAPAIPPGQSASDLLRRRPDVIAAERRLAASNARIGVAIAEYYPKVSLSALLGFESLSGSHLWSAESFQPEATAGLRWRLFDFGKVDAEVAQANSANAQVLLTYRQTVLRATEDVENSFMALAQLELQTRDLVNEVDALARARDASQQSYLGGASSLTDVLDADRQSLVAQDELARTRADTDRAAVMSFRALGGGWSM